MLQIFFAFKRKQIATDTCMLLQLAGARAPAGSPEGAAGPVAQKQVVPVGLARNCRPQTRAQSEWPTGKVWAASPTSFLVHYNI